MSENKTGKYLKYAIGEIVLVVIGILIALQINNANEQRKQNKLEQDYLIALKTEFENNLAEANRVIALNAALLKNAQELATFTGPELPDITEKKFGQLFFGTLNAEVQYRPGTGVTNEILSSGKLSVFKNRELKNALAALDGLLLKIRFQENEELSTLRYDLLSLGYDNVGLRKMANDTFGAMFGVDRGRFLDGNLHLLTSRKFDNCLLGFIYTSAYLDERYKELKEQLQKIIKIIDSQIE